MDEDLDLLNDLLNEDQSTTDKVKRSQLPKAIQVGPVRWYDNMNKTCASRGCGSPTMKTLRGIPYCSVHIVHQMNRELRRIDGNEWIDKECSCKAGKYSSGNTHTSDCAIYERLKEADVS